MTLKLAGPVGLADPLLAEAKLAPQFHTATTTSVTIVDRHMGSGKTTGIIASIRPDRKCLVVVPTLSEVSRIIKASGVPIFQPVAAIAEAGPAYPANAIFRLRSIMSMAPLAGS